LLLSQLISNNCRIIINCIVNIEDINNDVISL